ncbi:O-antigen ligase family protein [Butyrivibrio sp. FCS014]|uniref:O-antigen ligase family protein n=1 Tax=Butyrivibrio sp. FCS014 TaxID=1408304 RepID=UPI0004662E03|nr:hypothetical protein [Butyrivibrio sp. FCS014]
MEKNEEIKKMIETKNIICKQKLYKLLFGLFILLLIFQSPLESVVSYASYIDEAAGLIGGIFLLFNLRSLNEKFKNRFMFLASLFFPMFFIVGIISTLAFNYQPFKYWVIDAYTNVKFFLIVFGFYAAKSEFTYDETGSVIVPIAKISTVVLFVLLIIDYFFNIWYVEIRRFGRAYKLIYFHPTYLAGAVTFLLAIFALYYRRRVIPYILLDFVLLFATQRAKAFGGIVVFIILWAIIKVFHSKLKVWELLVAGVILVIVGWHRIAPFFIQLRGYAARSLILETGIQIMKDYFPIGTGFGTFSSHVAAEHYSPVYILYGLIDSAQLSLVEGRSAYYFDDMFWPIIMGQTGIIGTVLYVLMLGALLIITWNLYKKEANMYFSAMFIWGYLMISSTTEPTFNNSVSIPLAVLLGLIYGFSEMKGGSDNV